MHEKKDNDNITHSERHILTKTNSSDAMVLAASPAPELTPLPSAGSECVSADDSKCTN